MKINKFFGLANRSRAAMQRRLSCVTTEARLGDNRGLVTTQRSLH